MHDFGVLALSLWTGPPSDYLYSCRACSTRSQQIALSCGQELVRSAVLQQTASRALPPARALFDGYVQGRGARVGRGQGPLTSQDAVAVRVQAGGAQARFGRVGQAAHGVRAVGRQDAHLQHIWVIMQVILQPPACRLWRLDSESLQCRTLGCWLARFNDLGKRFALLLTP